MKITNNKNKRDERNYEIIILLNEETIKGLRDYKIKDKSKQKFTDPFLERLLQWFIAKGKRE